MKKLLSLIFRQAPETYIGLIVLTIITSVLYDLLVKPGLSTLGRFCLDTLSLGSSKVRDYVYESASFDPNPIAPLLLMCIATVSIPIVMVLLPTLRRYMRNRFENAVELARKEASNNNIEDEETVKKIIEEKMALLRSSTLKMHYIVNIPAVFILIFVYFFNNQSVAIWRVFRANLKIASPYIQENERLMLDAKFSGMKTRSEYFEIQNTMSEIAKNNGVILKDYKTW